MELRKLRDLTNATVVAKITYLALNVTNLEIKEAFELMMKSGTPDPKDFKYAVPDYNGIVRSVWSVLVPEKRDANLTQLNVSVLEVSASSNSTIC